MNFLLISSKFIISNDSKKSKTSLFLALCIVIIASNPLTISTAFYTTDKQIKYKYDYVTLLLKKRKNFKN